MKIKKRKLLFLSYRLSIVKTVVLSLILLKKLIVYRLRGSLPPKQILLMKPGKKRF